MTATATTPEQVAADPALAGVQLLTAKQLGKVLGLHPRTLWRMVARAQANGGGFPLPIKLSARCVRWKLEDVRAYLDHLAEGGRG